jgi:predicted O-methyltransferase YrrM
LDPDKLYSMDWTVPVDYEPSHQIDYAKASLTDLADHFKTDKGTIKHNYTPLYERYLAPLRTVQGVRIVEVGVACGSSLKMWSKYFRDAQIIGVDIRPECAGLCKRYPNVSIRIVDAAKQKIANEVDVFIDDGSHVSADIVDTFRLNWPSVKKGGLYIIEDLRCTHDKNYPKSTQYNFPLERFAREHFMTFVDRQFRALDTESTEVEFMHFYRQMAFIAKKK